MVSASTLLHLRPQSFDGHSPISYFAAFPETRIVFSVCLTIAAVSFWIFTRFHLPKYYVVPVRLFTASMLGYAVLALTPFDPNNFVSDTVHLLLALFFSLTFLVGIYIMGKRNKDLGIRPASYWAVGLSGLIMLLFLATPKGSNLVLLLEALSVLIMQAWIIWISFHSFKAVVRKPLNIANS